MLNYSGEFRHLYHTMLRISSKNCEKYYRHFPEILQKILINTSKKEFWVNFGKFQMVLWKLLAKISKIISANFENHFGKSRRLLQWILRIFPKISRIISKNFEKSVHRKTSRIILKNCEKYFRYCLEIFWKISRTFSENFKKYFENYIEWKLYRKILKIMLKIRENSEKFRKLFWNISWITAKNFEKYFINCRELFYTISRIIF